MTQANVKRFKCFVEMGKDLPHTATMTLTFVIKAKRFNESIVTSFYFLIFLSPLSFVLLIYFYCGFRMRYFG